MYKVIGKVGCTNCVQLKEKLTREEVEFEYTLLEDLDRAERRKFIGIARDAGYAHFPLVFEGDNLIMGLEDESQA